MFKFLTFASGICCGDRSEALSGDAEKETNEDNTKEETAEKEKDEFMIWTLRHHVHTHYSHFNDYEKLFHSKTDFSETTKSLDTDTNSNNSRIEETNTNFTSSTTLVHSKPIVLPLNLDELRKLNYDSEQEVYKNMEDKLKKIKKKFNEIK